MPIDTLMQLLQLALAVIGTLIGLLIALIVYVFLSLTDSSKYPLIISIFPFSNFFCF